MDHSRPWMSTESSPYIHPFAKYRIMVKDPAKDYYRFKYRSYFDLKHEVDRLDLEPGNRLVNLQDAVCGP